MYSSFLQAVLFCILRVDCLSCLVSIRALGRHPPGSLVVHNGFAQYLLNGRMDEFIVHSLNDHGPDAVWYEKCMVFTPHRENPHASLPPCLCSQKQSVTGLTQSLIISRSHTFCFHTSFPFLIFSLCFSSFDSCPVSIGKNFPLP